MCVCGDGWMRMQLLEFEDVLKFSFVFAHSFSLVRVVEEGREGWREGGREGGREGRRDGGWNGEWVGGWVKVKEGGMEGNMTIAFQVIACM